MLIYLIFQIQMIQSYDQKKLISTLPVTRNGAFRGFRAPVSRLGVRPGVQGPLSAGPKREIYIYYRVRSE